VSLGSGDSVQEPLKVVVRLSAVLLVLVMLQGCATNGHGVRAEGSFENYVTKLRELGVGARRVQSFSGSIENSDQILSAALLELRLHPGAVQHRRVAERYRTLKILDAAFDHYSRARQLDRTDAASYDGLARIWRDWGFPHLGLADAARAVHYAPSWPAAHNTLGTILAAMDRVAEARSSYEQALALDRRAAYVLNNLCYLSFRTGQLTEAIEHCRSALKIDPSLAAARNNLALAYSADKRDDLALREFRGSGDTAAAAYNLGIALLAKGKYADASQAFDAASRERPAWSVARARARSTRALAAQVADVSQ